MTQLDTVDITIVGAGVIGLAVARQLVLERRVGKRTIVLLDQERSFGQHTSSRNSEVIHAGIYYPSGSLKARLCVRGKALLYDYCQRYGIAHRACGKLIVAQPGEEAALEALREQALANGVDDLDILDRAQIRDLEPDIQGSAALLSPSTGIVDSHQFMQSLLTAAEQAGVLFTPLTSVTALRRAGNGFDIAVSASDGRQASAYRFHSRALINCAGLWAGEIAALLYRATQSDATRSDAGFRPPPSYWCKGDYFSYHGPARFKHLVYPLPEAGTRGLGVHATLDLGNQIRFGPDSYYLDGMDYTVDGGKAETFAAAIRRYLPSIAASQLRPAYAGIRPKLAGPGEPAADFMIATANGERSDTELHLLGIESPGLTASLALAEEVASRLAL